MNSIAKSCALIYALFILSIECTIFAATCVNLPGQSGCGSFCILRTDGNCWYRCNNYGGVYFDAPEDPTCTFVMRYPCTKSVTCWVVGSDCCPMGSDGAFSGPPTWKIEGSTHGLKIKAIPTDPDKAILDPESSTAAITPGALVVVATDGIKSKRGTIYIEVDDCNDGSCTAGPLIGSTSTGNGSVVTTFALGKGVFGKSAGNLRLKELYPTNLLYTPACLGWKYGTNTGCEVLTNSLGIRQVKAHEGLADVVTQGTNKYFINIFPMSGVGALSGGFYQTSGLPLVTITVENPDSSGNTTNRLRITDGYGKISDFEWKTNGWELVKGGGILREYKTATWNSNSTIRTSTVEVRDSNTNLVSCRIKKYQAFPFGTNIIEDSVGDGSAILTTTYSYFTNGVGSTGMLARVDFEDGRWECYEYDQKGRKTNACVTLINQQPTNDISISRSFEYAYDTNAVPGSCDSCIEFPGSPRCTIERIKGHEIGRSYLVLAFGERKEIRCINPAAAWNDSSNLVTISRRYTNGPNAGRHWNVERPDGTMDIFQYYFYTNGAGEAFRTNIVLSGAPDSAKTNIIDGTKTITVLGNFGQTLSRVSFDIVPNILTLQETHSEFDDFHRAKKVSYLDGTETSTDYNCCGPIKLVDREGTISTNFIDGLNRQVGTKRNGITHSNVLDPGGNVLRNLRIGNDQTVVVLRTNGYDTSGRLIISRDALGNATSYSESTTTNGQTVKTTSYQDGSTRIETFYLDGQLAKISGTAVHGTRYEYGVEEVSSGVWQRITTEIKLDATGQDTAETNKTYFDMLGRAYKTVFADGAKQESFFNGKGQLVKQVDPDGVTTLFAYSAKGEQALVAKDFDRDGIIDTNGLDRLEQTIRVVTTNGIYNVQRTLTYRWLTNNSGMSNWVAVSESTVDGKLSWTGQSGVTNRSGIGYAGNGNRYVTNTAPDSSYTLSHYLHGQLQSLLRKDASGNQLSQVNYFYDAHGRQYASTDARNGTSFLTYNNADRVVSTITPAPGSGAGAQTTVYEHDWAGRVTRTILPDGASLTNEYHPTGELKKTYGSRNYPVQYGYDAQGRRTNMITWKNFAADSGKATTVWKYDGYRGFMTNKVYDDGKGPFYSYTLAGRMRMRTWARGTTTEYHTNALGEIYATTYSDGTPAVTNYLDRLGRPTNIVDGTGSRFLVYGENGQVVSETNSTGSLLGANLRYAYDHLNRRTNHQVYATNTALLGHSFAFDSSSRITNVSDGVYQAGYSYLANSPLISQITYRSNTITRMTTTRTHDFLNRLTRIESFDSQLSTLNSSTYSYNDANQRTRVNLDDGSFWIYEYDSLGQLISGKRYWSDWTPVAGQQYEYAFDDIGNRTSTKAGGDDNGSGLRSASYTANALNQYSTRDVPGYLNVLGIVHANASVTVNSQSPYRQREYFWQELQVVNTNGAQWQSITNFASLTGTNQTNTGNLFLPKTAETYTYDADGNLTSDGRWTNRWDGENRLIEMTSHGSGPSGSRKALQFGYDSQSRRYSKIVSNWTGSAWIRALHEKFVYDGWSLLAVLNGTNGAIAKSFLWGLDLSGSLQGAGGVGGLLFFTQHSTSPPSIHAAAYDGNGNVMALVDSSGNVSARYEYDPFGQTIRASDPAATLNPVRFSSKHVDEETDYTYYGYRYLNPNAGRWLSRDPLEDEVFAAVLLKTDANDLKISSEKMAEFQKPDLAQKGSEGFYVFASNDSNRWIDPTGLVQWSPASDTGADNNPWNDSVWGDIMRVSTDAGSSIPAWKPHDGRTYWCHGYTFDGASAAGGPFSIWGNSVMTVLRDDGWLHVCCAMADGGIAVFGESAATVEHSGKIAKIVTSGVRFNEHSSQVTAKWGQLPLRSSSFANNAAAYGKYKCYVKKSQEKSGCCPRPGDNETPPRL